MEEEFSHVLHIKCEEVSSYIRNVLGLPAEKRVKREEETDHRITKNKKRLLQAAAAAGGLFVFVEVICRKNGKGYVCKGNEGVVRFLWGKGGEKWKNQIKLL